MIRFHLSLIFRYWYQYWCNPSEHRYIAGQRSNPHILEPALTEREEKFDNDGEFKPNRSFQTKPQLPDICCADHIKLKLPGN